MANDESEKPSDEHSGSTQSGDDTASPITITTTDPVIEAASEHPADWKIHPDSTVRVETTQASEPNLLYFPGIKAVQTENAAFKGRPNGGDGQIKPRTDASRQDNPDQDHRANPPQPRQSSMTKSLLMSVGVALVCGMIGAFGYLYFFGSKDQKSSSDQSKAKTYSRSQGGVSSQKGGAFSPKTSSCATDYAPDRHVMASSSSVVPDSISAGDLDRRKKQTVGST